LISTVHSDEQPLLYVRIPTASGLSRLIRVSAIAYCWRWRVSTM